MGRFEEALVFYHTGCRQRPDMDLFHQGVRKAQEAIEISLGGTKLFKIGGTQYDSNWANIIITTDFYSQTADNSSTTTTPDYHHPHSKEAMG